jgi:hypothetical protein
MNLGNGKTGTRSLTLGGIELPAGVAADVRYDLKGWSWTLGGAWRAVAKPAYALDVIAGARLLDIQQNLDWTLTGNVGSVALADRTGSRESRLRNWDAILGVKGRYTFRYLGYNMKSGQPLQDLSFNGPMVSAVFHW